MISQVPVGQVMRSGGGRHGGRLTGVGSHLCSPAECQQMARPEVPGSSTVATPEASGLGCRTTKGRAVPGPRPCGPGRRPPSGRKRGVATDIQHAPPKRLHSLGVEFPPGDGAAGQYAADQRAKDGKSQQGIHESTGVAHEKGVPQLVGVDVAGDMLDIPVGNHLPGHMSGPQEILPVSDGGGPPYSGHYQGQRGHLIVEGNHVSVTVSGKAPVKPDLDTRLVELSQHLGAHRPGPQPVLPYPQHARDFRVAARHHHVIESVPQGEVVGPGIEQDRAVVHPGQLPGNRARLPANLERETQVRSRYIPLHRRAVHADASHLRQGTQVNAVLVPQLTHHVDHRPLDHRHDHADMGKRLARFVTLLVNHRVDAQTLQGDGTGQTSNPGSDTATRKPCPPRPR